MDLKLRNKTAIITGASQGIGLEIARSLAAEGVRCILISRNSNTLKLAVKSLPGNGHEYHSLDLMVPGLAERTISKILEVQKIDICIHNLGGTLGVKSSTADIDDWFNVLMFNVGVAIRINNLLIPKMIDANYGRIVHISSISGESLRGSAPYAAAKAFLNAYIKVLARENAQNNIVISGVLPGAIYSEGGHWDENSPHNAIDIDAFYKKKEDFLRHHHAVGRLGLASEISPWVSFLCSEQASFAIGTLIPIDGGTM